MLTPRRPGRHGPAVSRLTQTYPTAEAYVDVWRAYPALANAWTRDVEQVARYDLGGEASQLRSLALLEAASGDLAELLASGERIEAALDRLASQAPLLRAPAGLLGQPPGVIADDQAAYWQARSPALAIQTIPETNHYTIVFSEAAAKAIATQIVSA
jgi:hypothetical protein